MARNLETAARTAVSVRDRLKTTAKAEGHDTRFLEQRFALERFLERLGASSWDGNFTLKGGLVMIRLDGQMTRPTEDMDAHSEVELTPELATSFVAEVCETEPAHEDGLAYDTSGLTIKRIMDGTVPGLRLQLRARWIEDGKLRDGIPVKLDLAWGDSVLDPVMGKLPAVLPSGYPGITMRMYPWEQVLAEKVHSLARHGIGSTRMKDFYDLAVLSRKVTLDAGLSARAIRQVFESWVSPALSDGFDVFDPAFAKMAAQHWKGFLAGKNGVKDAPPTLAAAIAELSPMVVPLIDALTRGEDPSGTWMPGNGWDFSPVSIPSP